MAGKTPAEEKWARSGQKEKPHRRRDGKKRRVWPKRSEREAAPVGNEKTKGRSLERSRNVCAR